MSSPPEASHPRTVTGRFPPAPESAGRARQLAVGACRDWALAGLADVVQLVVAELVANAIRHARTDVVVRLEQQRDGLRLEVSDDDAVHLPRCGTGDTAAESGRGLQLVEALSRGWGVLEDGPGKRVWAEIAR